MEGGGEDTPEVRRGFIAAHFTSNHPDPGGRTAALGEWATLPQGAGSLGPVLANREQRDRGSHLGSVGHRLRCM